MNFTIKHMMLGRRKCVGVAATLLLVTICDLASALQPSTDTATVHDLARQVEQLRSRLVSYPSDVNSLLDLAMACQQLNFLKPDGGTRVQEGVTAYR